VKGRSETANSCERSAASLKRCSRRQLRELEQRRLLIRRVHNEVPPHVEYELTALGQSLAKAISALDDWVIRNYQRTVGS
jgi:DNA-binding HxlR family transcriptional regulator